MNALGKLGKHSTHNRFMVSLCIKRKRIQLNLSTTATLGRFKQESMYGFFVRLDEKYGRCREEAVSGGGSTVFKNTAENHDIIHIPVEFYNLY